MHILASWLRVTPCWRRWPQLITTLGGMDAEQRAENMLGVQSYRQLVRTTGASSTTCKSPTHAGAHQGGHAWSSPYLSGHAQGEHACKLRWGSTGAAATAATATLPPICNTIVDAAAHTPSTSAPPARRPSSPAMEPRLAQGPAGAQSRTAAPSLCVSPQPSPRKLRASLREAGETSPSMRRPPPAHATTGTAVRLGVQVTDA